MKKIKLFVLSFGMVFISMFAVACSCNTNQNNIIKIEKLNFVYEDKVVTDDGLEIECGSTNALMLTYAPENATDTKFRILDYSTDIVDVSQDEENPCLFKVVAKSEYDNTLTNLETVLRVGVDGDTEIEPASCKITIVKDVVKLPTPTNLNFDGTKLEWNAVNVDKFESYTLSINGTEFISHTSSFDFENVNIYDTELKVKIKSNGSFSFYDSDYSEEISFTKLSSPQEITFENGIVSFTPNNLALKHQVVVNNISIDVENTETQVDISEYLKDAGDYAVYVIAKAEDGSSVYDSFASEIINIKRLGSVDNFVITNGTLSWDAVLGAISYDVCYKEKDGESQQLTTQFVKESVSSYTFKLNDSFLASLNEGEYEFTVVARGDNKNILDGSVGKISNIQKLGKVNISLKEQQVQKGDDLVSLNVVTWDKLNDEEKYEVILNGANPVITNINYIDFNSNYDAGEYSVKVRILGDGEKTFSGQFSNEISVRKLQTIDVNTFNYDDKTGQVTFTANYVDEQSFEILVNDDLVTDVLEIVDGTQNIDNKDIKVAFNIFDYANESGKYNITVKCKNRNYVKPSNDNSNFYGYTDSEYSEYFTLTKLEKPTLTFDGSKFNISNTQNNCNYNVRVYNVTKDDNDQDVLELVGGKENLSSQSFDINSIELEKDNSAVSLEAGVTYLVSANLNGKSNNTNLIYSNESEMSKFQILGKAQVTINSVIEKENELDYYTSTKLNILNTNENASSYDYIITDIATNNAEKIAKTSYDSEAGYNSFISKYSSSAYNKGIKVSVVANGKAGATKNDINYISSGESESVTLYQLPVLSIAKIENSKVILNKVAFDGYSNNEVRYSFRFKINEDVVYIENNILFNDSLEDVEYLLTNAVNYIFSLVDENNDLKYDLTQSGYKITVDVVANGNDYLLSNKVSSTKEFIKLQTPSIKVTDIQPLLSAGDNITMDLIPGQLQIDKIENAINYVIYPYLDDALYGQPITIGSFNSESVKILYQDNNTDGGNYRFKIVASGNNKNILQSEMGYLDVVKYTAPTLTIKNGLVNWSSSYNQGALSLDSVFIVEIGSDNIKSAYYLPYELSADKLNDLQTLLAIKNKKSMQFPDSLPSGENYTVSIHAVPVNITSTNNIISDKITITNVRKLATPATTIIKNGKFYFSNVIGATTYDVKVNDDLYTLNVENGVISSTTENAFELTLNNENLYTFNFDTLYGTKPGDYQIKVRACTKSENVVNSSYTVACKTTVLTTPKVSIENGVVKYTKVDSASKYVIKIYKAVLNGSDYEKGSLVGSPIEVDDISLTTYDFVQKTNNGNWMYDAGDYIFEIVAFGDEINFITKTQEDTDENIKYLRKLATPTDLKIKQGKLAWTSQEDVITYKIYAVNTKEIQAEIQSTDKTYALTNQFVSGDYSSIKLQLLGKNDYLNSNISNNMVINSSTTSHKLEVPKFYTNAGQLFWQHDNDYTKTLYYELLVGTNVYNIGNGLKLNVVNDTDSNTSSSLKIQLYKIENNRVVIDTGKYLELTGGNKVQIRAIGSYDSDVSGCYFTSDYSDEVTIGILNNVSNVKVVDGELTWTNPKNDIDNLTLIYTMNDDLEEHTVNISDLTTYHFDLPATYNVYFKNVGSTTGINQSKYTINSKVSMTYRLVKIDPPVKIESQLDDVDTDVAILTIPKQSGYKYKFVLDDTILLYAGEENSIKVKIKTDNGKNKLVVNGNEVQDYTINEKYTIKAMYLGYSSQDEITNNETYKLNSEYSKGLVGTIPDAPVLKVETAMDTSGNEYYTGRVYWDKVTFNNGEDVVDKYVIVTYYSSGLYTINNTGNNIVLSNNDTTVTFENELPANVPEGFDKLSSQSITITDTFINASASGTYVRYIKSLLTDSGSYSGWSVCAFSYNVYNNGDGSEENPYEIVTFNHLYNIRYNMRENVYYKLMADLDFTNETQAYSVIGDENDMFNANFDGNGYTISNILVDSVVNDYVGVFGYTGTQSKISNLTVENFRTRYGFCTGAIAGYNQGEIKNCNVSGEIGTNYSSLNSICYNGGIVGYNAGTIIGCESNVNILTVSVKGDKSTYAGGIAGCNGAGAIIEKCVNNGQIGNDNYASQYAGGLVGDNYGSVSLSKNTNNVYAMSVANNFEAYAGGLVGRNNSSGYVEDCLTNGNVNGYYNNSSANLYVGGLIGYNNGEVYKCMLSISSVGQKITVVGRSSGSKNIIIGGLIGQNLSLNVDSVCIYDNITITANNINTSKFVGAGYTISNSNFSDVILVADATTLNDIISNFENWQIDNDIPDIKIQ